MSSHRTIKVFVEPKEQEKLAKEHTVVERYDGFVVLKVSESAARKLAKSHLVEDITEDYAIRVDGRELVPAESALKKTHGVGLKKGEAVNAPSAGPHHFLAQFIGPVKDEWLKLVKKAGGEIREPMGGFVYVVRAKQSAACKIASLPCVRWIGHFPHAERIADSTRHSLSGGSQPASQPVLPRRRVLADVFAVEFFGSADAKAGIKAVKQLGIEILSDESKSGLLVVRAKGAKAKQAKLIDGLSAIHGVRRIRERVARRTTNDVAAGIMGTAKTVASPGLGLSGQGEIVGICDTGFDTGIPTTIHKDFSGRIVAIKSYSITPDLDSFLHNPRADDGPSDLDSGHGTHVAGSVLGDGTVSQSVTGAPLIRGLAHRARLVFQAVEQETKWKSAADLEENGRYGLWGLPHDLKTLFQFAYQKGARIHSNSWGGGDPGVYDAQCRQLDRFVWDRKDFCILVAAGNDGSDKDGDGRINPTSVTSPATAKNCITIGASENNRSNFNTNTYGQWWPQDYPASPHKNDPIANNANQVAAFSSRGPTVDNRIKPDVVAPGTFILSTRSTLLAANNFGWEAFPPSKKYFYMGGTSMATPLTAGAVALLREYLRTVKGIANPSAALLKATLIAGAQRLTGYAPAGSVCDNHQGFGRVHLDSIVAPTAPASTRFLEVQPGLTTGAVHSLTINVKSSAVPLRIVLAYSDFPGPALVNNLNLIATAPTGTKLVGNQRAGSSASTIDTKNNVEVIHVPNPAVGNWQVDIVASNVSQGPQDFALVTLAHQ